jgi:hypothetical protein
VVTRVPIDVVLYALRRTGLDVTAGAVRKWTFRGHITHTADGYDLEEIRDYLTRRDHDQLTQS